MIGRLQGKTVAKHDRGIILDVGGVGYLVALTTDTLTRVKLGQTLTLYTHLAARENLMELFGFEAENELRYFTLLLTVPGVGPKSALAIISLAGPEVLEKAIASEDTDYLTRVSGIGRKSAEKIILNLKDKVAISEQAGDRAHLEAEVEALEALRSLGYTTAEARTALKKVTAGENAGERSSTDLIKSALKNLADQNQK